MLDQQGYDTQKYLVDQLVATVQGDQAAIENAHTRLDYTRITAPLAGRVGVRLVDLGNIIHAGDTGGVVVITQVQPVSVVFTLPEQNLQLIRDQYPSGGAQGRMKVVAMGRDQKNALGDGMLAIIDNVIDNVIDLTVPASVVQRGPKGAYVFVIKDDETVDTHPVKVAQTEDGVALLDDGVKAGEPIVVDGQYKPQAGSKVTLTNENGDGQPPASRGGGDHKRIGRDNSAGAAARPDPGVGVDELDQFLRQRNDHAPVRSGPRDRRRGAGRAGRHQGCRRCPAQEPAQPAHLQQG